MDKAEIRRLIKMRKRMLTQKQIEDASHRLAQQLVAYLPYQQADTIYGYISYNQEVNTMPILEHAFADGKRVAVPKVYGNEMKFIYITDLSGIKPGFKGIPEPVADTPVANDPGALVLMPGLVFDTQGHRIGYGGGFYDRFLAAEPMHPTVALCYDFQVLSRIEPEAHDISVDLVMHTAV